MIEGFGNSIIFAAILSVKYRVCKLSEHLTNFGKSRVQTCHKQHLYLLISLIQQVKQTICLNKVDFTKQNSIVIKFERLFKQT